MRRVLLMVVLALLAGACTDGLAFRQDQRVSIESPRYREKVPVPVTLEWSVDDELQAALDAPDGGVAGFAVLVDLGPQPAGEPMSYYARDDDSCRASDGCPDLAYLADRGIFTTRATRITIDHLRPRRDVDLAAGHRDTHEVTLILLDERGRRIGQAAWTILFEVDHDEA